MSRFLRGMRLLQRRGFALPARRVEFRKTRVSGSVSKLIYSGILSYFGLSQKEIKEEDRLLDTIKLGIFQIQKGELDRGEMILHIAQRMAFDVNDQNTICYIHDVLANLAYEKGDYIKAESLFIDVMKRQIGPPKNLPQSDNSLVEISLKLADIYLRKNEISKAEKGLLFCIETQESKIASGENDDDTIALWGMSRDKYGEYLLNQGNVDEALRHFQSAYKICIKLFGEEHPQALIILNSIGTAYTLIQDYSKAVKYFEKAVKLGVSTNSDNLQHFLINLGVSRMKRGLIKEAIEACREGLKHANKKEDTESASEANECLKMAKAT